MRFHRPVLVRGADSAEFELVGRRTRVVRRWCGRIRRGSIGGGLGSRG